MKKLTVAIPYKSAGGIIHNRPVEFEVSNSDGMYRAVPLLSEDQRRIANLSPELLYRLENGKARSLRGIKDGNQHVIDTIAAMIDL